MFHQEVTRTHLALFSLEKVLDLVLIVLRSLELHGLLLRVTTGRCPARFLGLRVVEVDDLLGVGKSNLPRLVLLMHPYIWLMEPPADGVTRTHHGGKSGRRWRSPAASCSIIARFLK